MYKKLLSLMMTVAMVLSMLPCTALADITSVWDGTIDKAWYDNNPSADVYIINTAAELAGLAALVNQGENYNFWGKTIKLGVDIDLNDISWTPIGTEYPRYFAGEFDGNGHTISNLTIYGTKYSGLFGQVGRGAQGDNNLRKGAYIHDFTIHNATLTSLSGTSGVVVGNAYHDNVFENITVENATLTGSGTIGGIIGSPSSSQFKNILAKNITINRNGGGQVGGMFGVVNATLYPHESGYSRLNYYTNGYCLPGTLIMDGDTNDMNNPVVNSYFENCDGENIIINVQYLSGSNDIIGGFTSYNLANYGGAILCEDCNLSGLQINISAVPNKDTIVGGFIGLRAGHTDYTYTNSNNQSVSLGGFNNCSVTGSINGNTGYYGGFVAQSKVYNGNNPGVNEHNHRNATADVDITASENATVGGFAGMVDTSGNSPSQNFVNCTANGTITLGNNVPASSGFIGSSNTGTNAGITLTDCQAEALKNLDALWNEAKSNDSTLDEIQWKQDAVSRMMYGSDTLTSSSLCYTIIFDTDGGTPIAPITQAYGTPVVRPADPTKAGFTFAGWDKEIPTVMPAEKTTITAKWISGSAVDALPSTGDTARPVFWASCMLLSMAALVVLLLENKKKLER